MNERSLHLRPISLEVPVIKWLRALLCLWGVCGAVLNLLWQRTKSSRFILDTLICLHCASTHKGIIQSNASLSEKLKDCLYAGLACMFHIYFVHFFQILSQVIISHWSGVDVWFIILKTWVRYLAYVKFVWKNSPVHFVQKESNTKLMCSQLLRPLVLMTKSRHACSNDRCEGVMATIKTLSLKLVVRHQG